MIISQYSCRCQAKIISVGKYQEDIKVVFFCKKQKLLLAASVFLPVCVKKQKYFYEAKNAKFSLTAPASFPNTLLTYLFLTSTPFLYYKQEVIFFKLTQTAFKYGMRRDGRMGIECLRLIRKMTYSNFINFFHGKLGILSWI